MQKFEEIANECLNFLSKASFWIIVILMGLAGKLGLYLLGEKKLSFRQLVGSFLIAASVGIGSAIICYIHYPAPPGQISIQGAVIVPVSGILSDRILLFLMAMDAKKTMKFLSDMNWISAIKLLTSKKNKGGD
jgi:hypothetical protein